MSQLFKIKHKDKILGGGGELPYIHEEDARRKFIF